MEIRYDRERLMKRKPGARRTVLFSVLLVSLTLATIFGVVSRLEASLEEDGIGGQALFGADDDNLDNPAIQPPNTAANQSLNNADVLIGGPGNDVLIGLLGSDVLRGGPGNDILVGGTEQGVQPNSDIIFGDSGNDVNVWAPGDGSDAYIGGPGIDAMVFGVIDRDADNIPVLSVPQGAYGSGVPTANVSGQGGFCTLERVTDPAFGFEWLVRFFVRSTGALAVTIRLADVEQVFCTSQAGGEITYADLTTPNPQFVVIALADVPAANPTVALIIR